MSLPLIGKLSSDRSPFAVVTGAARGIGYELAHELARRGYDLFLCSESERIRTAIDHLSAFRIDIQGVQADLRKPKEVARFWAAVERTERKVDVCCINAGIGGEFLQTNLQGELDMIALNCASTVQLAKYVTAQMAQRRSGHILITSSIAETLPAPLEAVYAATKAFDLSFAKSLRMEMEKHNVVVTALQPGDGMRDTKAGGESKHASQPDEVARRALDALFAGQDHIYAGNLTLKMQGELGGMAQPRSAAERRKSA